MSHFWFTSLPAIPFLIKDDCIEFSQINFMRCDHETIGFDMGKLKGSFSMRLSQRAVASFDMQTCLCKIDVCLPLGATGLACPVCGQNTEFTGYAEVRLDLSPDEEFSFPADSDLNALPASHCKTHTICEVCFFEGVMWYFRIAHWESHSGVPDVS